MANLTLNCRGVGAEGRKEDRRSLFSLVVG